MKNLLVLLVLGALAWYGYGKIKGQNADPETFAPAAIARAPQRAAADTPQFSCDGRTHCSHMRSCAEATYFIRHCPGTKMDGDNDGVPCEQQWCN